MRQFLVAAFLCFFAVQLNAAEAKILKVLPHFLDKKGKHTLSPSLYERDAYQKVLRENPENRSAIRFDVQWKAPKNENYSLRAEMRAAKGTEIKTKTVETPVKKAGWFSTWSAVQFDGKEYREFGDIIAWRVTLVKGGKEVAEQKSFLW